MVVRRKNFRRDDLEVILFLSITACFTMMIAGLLVCLGLLGDIGAYLLGGLAVFVGEIIDAILVKRPDYHDETKRGDEHA